jgi:ketosteroid isomerase-like protein
MKGLDRTAISATVAAVALACGTVAHGRAGVEADAEAAMAATREVCRAFREGDVAAAERLLLPEFTLVSSSSRVDSRAEAIAEVRAREPRYERFENVDMTARVYGDVAMVRGVTRLAGTAAGERFELDVRFTDLLLRTPDGWKLVTSHVTRIPRE